MPLTLIAASSASDSCVSPWASRNSRNNFPKGALSIVTFDRSRIAQSFRAGHLCGWFMWVLVFPSVQVRHHNGMLTIRALQAPTADLQRRVLRNSEKHVHTGIFAGWGPRI